MTADLEPYFNVWIFIEPTTGLVMQTGVKAYALEGTDEEKLACLRYLSRTDFYTVERQRIPERYVLRGPQGQRQNHVVTVQMVPNTPLVQECIEALMPLPAQLLMSGDEPSLVSLPMGDAPLCVTTFIEQRHDGTLVPVLDRAEG